MKRFSSTFIRHSDTPIEQVETGIRRQMLGFDGQLMAARVWFDEGAEGYVHDHFHSQVSYVESGTFDVQVGDEVQRLVAGDSFYVAPNQSHGAVCIEAGCLLDIFSPSRQDFLTD